MNEPIRTDRAKLTKLHAEWYRHGLHDIEDIPAKELRGLVRSFGGHLLRETKRP